MRVYLCEKPSQARNVVAALGGGKGAKGYYETRHGIVTHGVGHLYQEADPDAYGWTAWSLDAMPMIPDKDGWKLEANPKTKDQLKIIDNLLKKATEVVIATDPDREGEAIARNILMKAGWWTPGKPPKGRLYRIWYKGEDQASIRNAIEAMHDASRTEPIYYAQRARARADWLVGMNLTRPTTALWAKGGALNCGRVLLPTLRLVVERDREIETFVPEDYFELSASVATTAQDCAVSVTLRHTRDSDDRLKRRKDAETLAEQVKGAQGPLQVTRESKNEKPPLPYTLQAVQADANRKWGWSANHTLEVAQQLYDDRRITYPRTDCGLLSDDQTDEVPMVLEHLAAHPEFRDVIPAFTPVIRKSVFSTEKIAKQEAGHTGLIPTLEPVEPGALAGTPDQAKLYDLIARRYIAAVMPDHSYESTRIQLDANGVLFAATGRVPLAWGWKAIWQSDPAAALRDVRQGGEDLAEGESGALPRVADQAPGEVTEVNVSAKQTQPPRAYTEATLLDDMEKVAKKVTDQKLKKVLKETSGIGTPPTRSATIEKLKHPKVGYISISKRRITSTRRGRQLIDALMAKCPTICDYGTTAIWEMTLDAIARAEAQKAAQGEQVFLERVAKEITDTIKTLRRDPGRFAIEAPPAAKQQSRSRSKNNGSVGKKQVGKRGGESKAQNGRRGGKSARAAARA